MIFPNVMFYVSPFAHNNVAIGGIVQSKMSFVDMNFVCIVSILNGKENNVSHSTFLGCDGWVQKAGCILL